MYVCCTYPDNVLYTYLLHVSSFFRYIALWKLLEEFWRKRNLHFSFIFPQRNSWKSNIGDAPLSEYSYVTRVLASSFSCLSQYINHGFETFVSPRTNYYTNYFGSYTLISLRLISLMQHLEISTLPTMLCQSIKTEIQSLSLELEVKKLNIFSLELKWFKIFKIICSSYFIHFFRHKSYFL